MNTPNAFSASSSPGLAPGSQRMLPRAAPDRERLVALLRLARDLGAHVHVDMESLEVEVDVNDANTRRGSR